MTIKHSLVVLTAAFALASTAAVAGDAPAKNNEHKLSRAMQMNDAQLDEITAAGASSFLFLSNPGGNTGFIKANKNHLTAINLVGVPSEHGATGILFLSNPAHPSVMRCIGSGC